MSSRLDIHEKEKLSNVKIIWVMGGPGAGKSTQANKIAQKYNGFAIGVGNLIRNQIYRDTDFGKEFESAQETGEEERRRELEETIVMDATKSALAEKRDFIIYEGWKTLEKLEKYLRPCDIMIHLHVDETTMKTRIKTRADIEGRRGDQKHIEMRIAKYLEINAKYLEFLKSRSYKCVDIDATQSEDEVFNNMCQEIEKLKASNNVNGEDNILRSVDIGNLIKRKVQEAHTDRELVDIDKKLTEIKWDKLKMKEKNDSINYDQLLQLKMKKNDSISMDQVWSLISRVLGKQLFGTQMYVVPNIGDIKNFDLLYCFVKKDGIKDRLKPVYIIAGLLQDLGQKTQEMGNNVEKLSKFLKSESYENYTQPYTLFWTNGEKGEKHKTISVTMTNFFTFVVPWNLFLESNISLAVEPGREELTGIKSIYIIDEVVYVDKIEIKVAIGEKRADMQISGNNTPRGIPLAFHYEKFSLDENGYFGDNNTDSGINPLTKFLNIH